MNELIAQALGYEWPVKTACIEWTGLIGSQGYGLVPRSMSRKLVTAPRFIWEKYFGPLPRGKCVLHKCDNRKCWNVVHLFIGTRADNNRDANIKKLTFTLKNQPDMLTLALKAEIDYRKQHENA